MSNPLRPILPNPQAQKQSPSSSKSEPGIVSNWDPQKRKQTTVACSPCRLKRAKCDGNRPQCQRCQAADLVCTYETLNASETRWSAFKRENASLKHSAGNLNRLFLQLSQVPEPAAQNILQRLRSAADPELMLRSLQDADDIDLYLQEMALGDPIDMRIRPPRPDWTIHHPMAHIQISPLLVRSMLQSLRPMADPDLKGNDATLGAIDTQALAAGINRHSSGDGLTLEPSENSRSLQSMRSIIMRPHEGAQLASFRDKLNEIDFRQWTRLPVDNIEAREAVLLYLATEHAVYGVFDVEAVLHDLQHHTGQYCSPFFVNALLASTFQAYTSRRLEAAQQSYIFEREAQRLSRAQLPDSLPSVAGWALLYLSLMFHNQCDLARYCVAQLVPMARRLRLFGVNTALTTDDLGGMPEAMKRVYTTTAWGAFNAVTMQVFMHVTEPFEHPPELLINPEPPNAPPEASTANPDSFIETTRIAFCRLHRIIANIFWVRSKQSINAAENPEFVMSQHHQLLHLLNNLPAFMKHKGDNPSYTMVFYIWFHAAILNLFRPLTLRSYNSELIPPAVAREIFRASLEQLKRLLLIFVDQYESASYTGPWHVAPLYVANAVLRDLNDPTWRLYFEVAIRAYRRYRFIYPSLQIMEDVLKGLLALAVELRALTESEALALAHGGPDERNTAENLARKRDKDLRGFVVDLDLALLKGDAARVDPFLDKFEEMVMFEEFTDRTSY